MVNETKYNHYLYLTVRIAKMEIIVRTITEMKRKLFSSTAK